MGGHDLTHYRQLSLVGRLLRDPVALFIAEEAEQSGIYGLSFASAEEPSLYGGYRLDDLSAGRVESYRALPLGLDRFAIVYQKSGSLRCTIVSGSSADPRLTPIVLSDGTDPVTDYGVFERFAPGHTSLSGYYLATGLHGERTLRWFAVVDDTLAESVTLETAANLGMQHVQCYFMSDGGTRVVWVNGSRVTSYRESEGRCLKDGEASLSGEKLSLFPISDGTAFHVASVGGANGELRADILAPVAPSFPVDGLPVIGDPGGLSSSRRRLFLLTFLTERDGQREIRSFLDDCSQSLWSERVFPVPAGARVLDAWFSGDLSARYAAVLAEDESGRHLLVYQISSTSPDYVQMLDLPVPAGPAPTMSGTVVGQALSIQSCGTTVMVDPGSWRSQSIEATGWAMALSSAGPAGVPGLYLVPTSEGSVLLRGPD